MRMSKQDLRADVVFMMDCTASMKPYINEMKRKIKDIAALWMKDFQVVTCFFIQINTGSSRMALTYC